MPEARTKVDTKLPSFAGATEWLNRATAAIPEAKNLKGHPTLVHFWSVSADDAKTNLTQVAQLRDQRKRDGLRVIAIHSPQSAAEKEVRVVRDAAGRFNLTEPCALDNDDRLRERFGHESEDLPAYYLFDSDGNLRRSATGAASLDEIEDQLDAMIAELRAHRPYCRVCEVF